VTFRTSLGVNVLVLRQGLYCLATGTRSQYNNESACQRHPASVPALRHTKLIITFSRWANLAFGEATTWMRSPFGGGSNASIGDQLLLVLTMEGELETFRQQSLQHCRNLIHLKHFTIPSV
jgi:hypothetical protein